MVEGEGVRLAARVRRRLVGCSLAAIVAATGGAAANAACTPNPPQPNGTTICSDRTDGGLVVTTNATVNVLAGATLAGGSGVAAFKATNPGNVYGPIIQLNVAGHVGGGDAAGVLVTNGTAGTYPFPSTGLAITVGASGIIDGATAITLQADPGTNAGNAAASIEMPAPSVRRPVRRSSPPTRGEPASPRS